MGRNHGRSPQEILPTMLRLHSKSTAFCAPGFRHQLRLGLPTFQGASVEGLVFYLGLLLILLVSLKSMGILL